MSRLVREVEEVEPDLIPIMNLFTALIPFLLMSATFYKLSIIKVSVPVASSSGETDVAKEEDKITLNLQIERDAFKLSASSDTLEPSVLTKLKASIPRPPGEEVDATYLQLEEAAAQIKGDYRASDTVIAVPDDDIPYEVVVRALDAVRQTYIERSGQRTRMLLFPRAVLSTRVK